MILTPVPRCAKCRAKVGKRQNEARNNRRAVVELKGTSEGIRSPTFGIGGIPELSGARGVAGQRRWPQHARAATTEDFCRLHQACFPSYKVRTDSSIAVLVSLVLVSLATLNPKGVKGSRRLRTLSNVGSRKPLAPAHSCWFPLTTPRRCPACRKGPSRSAETRPPESPSQW